MVKNREINGTEEIVLVTPTPGHQNEYVDVLAIWKMGFTYHANQMAILLPNKYAGFSFSLGILLMV